MQEIILYIAAAGAMLNAFMLAIIFAGWRRLSNPPASPAGPMPSVSVIIPARNEAASIKDIVTDIAGQDYAGQIELLLINDHSEDSTWAVCREMQRRYPWVKAAQLSAAEQGKKAAVKLGWDMACSVIIAQADADCRLQPGWLSALVPGIASGAAISFGPVAYTKGSGGLFSFFMELDIISLAAAGAAMASAGRPVYCSAANMCYLKAWLPSGIPGPATPSGDDVFLLRHIAGKGGRAAFAKDKQAIVHTPAPASVADFIAQRARWGGKSRHYGFSAATGLAIAAAAIALSATASAICWCAGICPLYVFLLAFMPKLIADTIIFAAVLPFYGSAARLLAFVPLASAMHPFYIIAAASAGMIGGYKWKGRSYSRRSS
jgi:poly-beta-1,6-N-acetyl-D-glucosamine synthase